MSIGVLALQGDVREHVDMLRALGTEAVKVRLPEELERLRGLIIPGGESTTIAKLARQYGLERAVRERYLAGRLAIWGTCAGAIWLARDIESSSQPRLGLLNATVQRNAFGRQVNSFEADLDIKGLDTPFHAVFIRAPTMTVTGPDVEVLARYRGRTVFARQARIMASSFHPELANDSRLHAMFLELASSR